MRGRGRLKEGQRGRQGGRQRAEVTKKKELKAEGRS